MSDDAIEVRVERVRPRLLAARDAAAYCGYECREAVYRVKDFPMPARYVTGQARHSSS